MQCSFDLELGRVMKRIAARISSVFAQKTYSDMKITFPFYHGFINALPNIGVGIMRDEKDEIVILAVLSRKNKKGFL